MPSHSTPIKNYATKYKSVFLLSWVFLYLIFPQAWALPVSVNIRAFIFLGLITYFSMSAYVMNLLLNSFLINEPLITHPKDFLKHVKNNIWLVIICCIAIVLNIYPISLPILMIGDEALHIQGGLWIYHYIDSYWHKYFQYVFWALIALLIFIIKQKTIRNYIANNLCCRFKSNNLTKLLFVLSVFFLLIYFFILRNLPYNPLLEPNYPPISKILYFISYLIVGINYVGPRVVQLMFYILSAIYLYRAITLFHSKETALLGSSIYLFFPLVFFYASLAELGSGTVFFIILISYYFLRFIKNRDIRDLLLTSYFTGVGFLYRRELFLMLFIAIAFLILDKLKKKDLNSIIHFKILLLSMIPIVPWLIIGKYFTWRNYAIQWSSLASIDSKVVLYFLMLPSSMPLIIFFLFLFSIAFILFTKKDTLSLFFGFLFIVFYSFYALDIGSGETPRLSLAFYPTIAVYLTLFISNIIYKMKWKHSFQLIFYVVTLYLIFICSVPSIKAQFLTKDIVKTQYFPTDEAMKWVKENVKDGEKIMTLRIMPAMFYRDKYGINRNNIVNFWYELDGVSTPDELKQFYIKNKISYIMFPYSHGHALTLKREILYYLKENKNDEFREIAKFNRGDSYIYIYNYKKVFEN